MPLHIEINKEREKREGGSPCHGRPQHNPVSSYYTEVGSVCVYFSYCFIKMKDNILENLVSEKSS